MWAFPRPTGTVVVGCDSSPESQNAVVAATLEASRNGTDLVVLAVAEHRPYWPVSVAWVSRAEAESAEHAQVAVDRAMARTVATDSAVAAQTVFVKDLDSPELADVARRAGMLVLGVRGGGGQVAFSLGSTSAELARRFHCPMLVAHDPGRSSQSGRVGQVSSVVAWMDTIGGAEAVLSVAVTEAVTRDLPLVVVHALQGGQGVGRAGVGRAVIAEGWRRCHAVMREAGLPAGVPNRLVVTADDPAAALLHRVRPGDLLVVGTRGQGRVAGLITGSVTREILDNMICDVMVVPPRVKAAAAIPSAAIPSPAMTSTLVGLAGRF